MNPLKGIFDNEELYIQKDSPYANLIAKELVQRFPAIGTALDIGCNTRELVHALRLLNIKGYGVDISEKATSYAQESVQEYLSQVDVDLEPLPFSEKRFDLVTAHRIAAFAEAREAYFGDV